MPRPLHLRACALVAALLAPPGAAAAQLRPLETVPLAAWDSAARGVAQFGAAVFGGQRASLAGARGRLIEAGNFDATWRTGRAVLSISGTAQRFFRPDTIYTAPAGDARTPEPDGVHDTGDIRFSTAVRVSPDGSPVRGTVRFGTRLPTTDNQVGLDRDQTDFWGLVGAGGAWRGLRVAGEAGVGIHGTRNPRAEQNDVLLYSLESEYPTRVRRLALSPTLALLGQIDTQSGRYRGTESLGEVRLGVRAGGARWVEARYVRGVAEFSPRSGLQAVAGVRW